MLGRLKALALLTFALIVTVLRRWLGRRRDGISAFRANYDADGLPPVTAEERRAMTGFQRCIACGLCDRGEAERIAASGGAYRGIMALVLAASRSMPDFRAAAYSFSFVPDSVLAEKETICPTGVPMRAIAAFVRAKADAVGGPLPLPARISSLRPPAPEAPVAAPRGEPGDDSVRLPQSEP
ncbi:MAG TPA: hypothetical protein VKY73_00995 [Polyangiaceae bacterium]|nr:hypothetical protein [Polyangiaceae bacterium]